MGRGVTVMSTNEYMVYHQKRLAQETSDRERFAAFRFLAADEMIGLPPDDFRSSRKYQPLPTMPSRGHAPVRKVDCTVVVTAGVTVVSGRTTPRAASAFRFGACTSSDGVRPTTSSTSVRFMNRLRLRETRRAWPRCVRCGRGARERHARSNNAARAIVRRRGRGLRPSLRAASPEHFSAAPDPSTQPSQKREYAVSHGNVFCSRDRAEGVRSPSIPRSRRRALSQRSLNLANGAWMRRTVLMSGRFEQRVIVRPVGSSPFAANFHIGRNRSVELFRKS